MCNGTNYHRRQITSVLKFGAHYHEGDTDLINIEKSKCIMKNTAKENYDLPRIYAWNVVNSSDESKQFIPIENSIKRCL